MNHLPDRARGLFLQSSNRPNTVAITRVSRFLNYNMSLSWQLIYYFLSVVFRSENIRIKIDVKKIDNLEPFFFFFFFFLTPFTVYLNGDTPTNKQCSSRKRNSPLLVSLRGLHDEVSKPEVLAFG